MHDATESQTLAAVASRWGLELPVADAAPAEPGCETTDLAEGGRGALPALPCAALAKGSFILDPEKKVMMPLGLDGCRSKAVSHCRMSVRCTQI